MPSYPQVSPPKPCIRLSSPPYARYMARPTYSSLFDHQNNITWAVQIISSSLCSFLHSPVTSSLLGPNILLSILFSKILCLRTSLKVSDQAAHPYTRTGKIIVLCILTFKCFIANCKTKILHRIIASIPWHQSALNFFLNRILIC